MIMCVTLKRRQRKKQLSCWEKKRQKEIGENDTVKKWIFFDFECTQDEMINCNKGYKPQYHIVCRNCNQYGRIPIYANKDIFKRKCQFALIVTDHPLVLSDTFLHKVWKECIDTDVIDQYSFCDICQYKERIFRGPKKRDEFCKWLFSEENKKSRRFCHNFWGYNSYPIVSYMYENAILPEVIMNRTKLMGIEVPHLKMKFIDFVNFIPITLS